MLKTVKHYLAMYWVFIKMCLKSQLEYRFNFIMSILVMCAWLCVKLIYLLVVYQAKVNINGMTPDEILLYVGIATIFSGIMNSMIFPNINRLKKMVRTGDLDLLIVKPISLQFIGTCRYMRFGLAIPDSIAGVMMIIIAWNRIGLTVSFIKIFILLMIWSLLIIYSILFLPTLISFWTIKIDAIFEIIWALWDFNKMPMNIYNEAIKAIGIYVIPLFVITNFPVLYLLDRMNIGYAIWGIISPIIIFVVLRLLWIKTIKKYSSASS